MLLSHGFTLPTTPETPKQIMVHDQNVGNIQLNKQGIRRRTTLHRNSFPLLWA